MCCQIFDIRSQALLTPLTCARAWIHNRSIILTNKVSTIFHVCTYMAYYVIITIVDFSALCCVTYMQAIQATVTPSVLEFIGLCTLLASCYHTTKCMFLVISS